VEPRAIKLNSSDLSKRSFFEVAQTFLGKTIHDIGKGLKLKPLQALTADAGLKGSPPPQPPPPSSSSSRYQ